MERRCWLLFGVIGVECLPNTFPSYKYEVLAGEFRLKFSYDNPVSLDDMCNSIIPAPRHPLSSYIIWVPLPLCVCMKFN